MVGRSFDVYWWELFYVPAPMECSFNYCSFKCAYCFANLNKPERKADIAATMRLLRDYPERRTLAAHLLREGYPVLVSNRVDPFAQSNFKQALPILEQMTELGIPLYFQTKGGPHAHTALSFLKPTVWYVSIAMLNDDLRKKIEPGAPSIESRFELIERLKAEGHGVFVGCNPLVTEWLSEDVERYLERIKNAGVEVVMTQPIHFNDKQLSNMSPREKEAIGEKILERSQTTRTRSLQHTDIMFEREFGLLARDIGLEHYTFHNTRYSKLPSLYSRFFSKRFPVVEDFINHLIDAKQNVVSFDDYANFFEPYFPTGTFNLGSYFRTTSYKFWKYNATSEHMTFRQLLAICWKYRETRYHPANHSAFSYAVVKEGKDYVQLVDEQDMPIMVFDPDGFDELFIEVENVPDDAGVVS